jgi:hypothetical protein
MSSKKPVTKPKAKLVTMKELERLYASPGYRELIVQHGGDDKRYWQRIAQDLRAAMCTRNAVFIEVIHGAPQIAYDNGHNPIPWLYVNKALRAWMWNAYQFDCALYPRLWRYLIEVLPIL